jgi:hypothetical protein
MACSFSSSLAGIMTISAAAAAHNS